ncbi:hypothetical protein J1N35_021703 [Gossypium stocksii]|uniref:BZIP domain-containing protein n=1 Tax=Gossypium stocksii TaxID=47602 RepID=A0A9D3VGR2_9ROSI|nr:hypothetical protein J1N35_021703 [Gossypium stocksii]
MCLNSLPSISILLLLFQKFIAVHGLNFLVQIISLSLNVKTKRRLAQNREAAKKSRLRKKNCLSNALKYIHMLYFSNKRFLEATIYETSLDGENQCCMEEMRKTGLKCFLHHSKSLRIMQKRRQHREKLRFKENIKNSSYNLKQKQQRGKRSRAKSTTHFSYNFRI